MIIPLGHILVFSAALFAIGLYGVLVRRNIIGILISIEIILNAVNINLVAFSRTTALTPESGQIFAIFIIAMAAATAAVGLAIVLALFRVKGTILADEITFLKG